MTKKDYEAFATMIRDNTLVEKSERDVGYNFALEDMAYDMCVIFAADNERFDKEKFLEACGL